MGSLRTIPIPAPTKKFQFKGRIFREESHGLILSEQIFQFFTELLVGTPVNSFGVRIGYVVEAELKGVSIEITCETALPLSSEVLSELKCEFYYSYDDVDCIATDDGEGYVTNTVKTAYLLGVNLTPIRTSNNNSKRCVLKEGT